jgi:transposase
MSILLICKEDCHRKGEEVCDPEDCIKAAAIHAVHYLMEKECIKSECLVTIALELGI